MSRIQTNSPLYFNRQRTVSLKKEKQADNNNRLTIQIPKKKNIPFSRLVIPSNLQERLNKRQTELKEQEWRAIHEFTGRRKSIDKLTPKSSENKNNQVSIENPNESGPLTIGQQS